MEGLCITGLFLLDRLWRSAGTIEHMFADRPDRSVGSFSAACGKFVQQSPGGGKLWGKNVGCYADETASRETATPGLARVRPVPRRLARRRRRARPPLPVPRHRPPRPRLPSRPPPPPAPPRL